MIHLTGATRISFTFPAPLPAAFAYYAELLPRLADYLPHVELEREHGPGQFRMCYHARELGAIDVRVYCDVAIELDAAAGVLRVVPLQRADPVAPRAGLYATSAQGAYASESRFHAAAGQTRIDFSLHLEGELPRPYSMRLLPGAAVDAVARAVAQRRIQEIAAGFIEATRAHYLAQHAPATGRLLRPISL